MANDFRNDNPSSENTEDRLRKEVEQLRSQLKALADKYGPEAREALQEAKKSAQQNIGDIEAQIRAKPVQATVIAAALGFLLGALLNR